MKITDKQLKKIIKEVRMIKSHPSPMRSRAHPAIRDAVKIQKLVEYEQYVDEEGNIWDDEGNVTRRGRGFGRQYGGDTYGLHAPWDRGSSRRSASRSGTTRNQTQIDAVKAILELKENKFLRSILQQLEAGRTLSAKQKDVVRKIIKKTTSDAGMVGGEEAAALFEGKKMIVTKSNLRRIIREAILVEEEGEGAITAAGKKTEQLMDSSAMNAFKTALDKATTKDSVKETLSQIFSGLGENGQKYLKMALKELAQEM